QPSCVPLKMVDNLAMATRPHFALLCGEVLIHKRAECVRRPLDPNPLLRCRVVPELDLGVELGRNLPGPPRLDRRGLSNYQPTGLAPDSVLEQPRPRRRLVGIGPIPFLNAANTKTESGNLIIEKNSVVLAGLQTNSRNDSFRKSHDSARSGKH